MMQLHLKRRLSTIVAFLVLAGILGVVVMVSGIVPIKASSGHWEITRWILDFSKSRSVATHSLGIKPPPLDDLALQMKGAGHYEVGCVPCHGSPTRPRSPIALGMTATPPALPPVIRDYDSAELFYIVKHGIKFTGMPAWPSQQRDDEVWAMVSFLQELPAMQADRYLRLTQESELNADVTIDGLPASLLESCHRCHGAQGQGGGAGAFPRLAGQKAEYLFESLQAFAAGERHSGVMQPLAAILDDEALSAIAEHYAALSPVESATTGGTLGEEADLLDEQAAASIERGRSIALNGLPEKNVPSCVDCHGPSDIQHSPIYPHLAGQLADYLTLQLQLFKQGHRGGTEAAHLMEPVVHGLKEDDMEDVAAYYASLARMVRPVTKTLESQ